MMICHCLVVVWHTSANNCHDHHMVNVTAAASIVSYSLVIPTRTKFGKCHILQIYDHNVEHDNWCFPYTHFTLYF